MKPQTDRAFELLAEMDRLIEDPNTTIEQLRDWQLRYARLLSEKLFCEA